MHPKQTTSRLRSEQFFFHQSKVNDVENAVAVDVAVFCMRKRTGCQYVLLHGNDIGQGEFTVAVGIARYVFGSALFRSFA